MNTARRDIRKLIHTNSLTWLYRYDSDNEMFVLRARACVDASKEIVYDPPATNDPHAIVFSPYQPAVHDPVREEMKKERVSLCVFFFISDFYVNKGNNAVHISYSVQCIIVFN